MTPAQYQSLAREDDIQNGICEYLKLRHIPFCVTDASLVVVDGKVAGRRCLQDGWPDVVAVLGGGRLLAIETKTQAGKLRPAQVQVLGDLQSAGAVVMIPRSVAEFVDSLERLLNDK
ncbi:MAG TPA: hypothetical protein VI756_11460 [Blastocatellia bacterium]